MSVIVDSESAKRIWENYQNDHDLSDRIGKTVGIDPTSGHLWEGDSIADVLAKRDSEGCTAPLYFVRVGFPTYYRKGGRR